MAKVTNWTNYICNTPIYSYVSGTTNQIVHGTGLTPSVNAGLSDIVQFRVIRDNANTSGLFSGIDPVNSIIAVKSFDVHYEKNQLGSTTEYTP